MMFHCVKRKIHSTALITLLPNFTKILSPNTGILIPLLFYQNIKNVVFSFGVDLNFKIESSNQEISLHRKDGRIYDSALDTVGDNLLE